MSDKFQRLQNGKFPGFYRMKCGSRRPPSLSLYKFWELLLSQSHNQAHNVHSLPFTLGMILFILNKQECLAEIVAENFSNEDGECQVSTTSSQWRRFFPLFPSHDNEAKVKTIRHQLVWEKVRLSFVGCFQERPHEPLGG